MRECGCEDKHNGVLMCERILGKGSRILLGLYYYLVTLASSSASDSFIVLMCVFVPMYGKRVVGVPSD